MSTGHAAASAVSAASAAVAALSSGTQALLNSTEALLVSSSTAASESTAEEVYDGLNNVWIAGWHVPLTLMIVLIVLAALFAVCSVVGCMCNGCLGCLNKTETVIDHTVQDFKGARHQKDLTDRRQKLALIRSQHSDAV